MPHPHPHADGGTEGVVDDVIRFAPAHLEQVLSGFGGNGAQTADKDDVLGLELRKQDREEVAEWIVEEDVTSIPSLLRLPYRMPPSEPEPSVASLTISSWSFLFLFSSLSPSALRTGSHLSIERYYRPHICYVR